MKLHTANELNQWHSSNKLPNKLLKFQLYTKLYKTPNVQNVTLIVVLTFSKHSKCSQSCSAHMPNSHSYSTHISQG